MRVRPPGGGFNTMTFESYSRTAKNMPKEEDCRLIVLKTPEKPEKPQEVDLGDFMFDGLPR
jgi:hypothetical protein